MEGADGFSLVRMSLYQLSVVDTQAGTSTRTRVRMKLALLAHRQRAVTEVLAVFCPRRQNSMLVLRSRGTMRFGPWATMGSPLKRGRTMNDVQNSKRTLRCAANFTARGSID